MRLKKIGFLVAAFSLTMGMSICARAGTYKLEPEATESKPTHYIIFDDDSDEFKDTQHGMERFFITFYAPFLIW